jgi:DNA-binding IclR family transcriptional regulator
VEVDGAREVRLGEQGRGFEIQSVARSLDVLDLLGASEMGVGDIARRLGVNKSTASRLLATMASRGYVARSMGSGGYRLGNRIAQLYDHYLQSLRESSDARYLLRRVATDTDETVLLTLFENDAAVYIDKIESRQPLRTSSHIGATAPFHSGAAGKSILAFLPNDVAQRLLGSGRLHVFTEHTITNRRELAAELARIRAQGYAISMEEINPGVVGIGVPLLAPDHLPFGAISVTCPTSRFSRQREEDIVRFLRTGVSEWLGETASARG